MIRPTIKRLVADPALPDLSMRQLAVLLYVRDEPKADCTVRAMAAHHNISKPAITRAADRLGELGLTTREIDRSDRRSVFVRLTAKGRAFLTAVDAVETRRAAA